MSRGIWIGKGSYVQRVATDSLLPCGKAPGSASIHLLLPLMAVLALVASNCSRDDLPPTDRDRVQGVIFRNDFDDDPTVTYTLENLRGDWRNPRSEDGVSEGRVAIVTGDAAFRGKSLAVTYTSGTVGTQGGARWTTALGAGFNELYCAYRIRFERGFDFVWGGKLPGLAGGRANTGGRKPDGSDGWSARMMWRRRGRAVQYVYHPDQPGIYGQDFPYDLGGSRTFESGRWHQVEHCIVINSPGKKDGIIQAWFDGGLALSVDGLRFRDVDDFAIDSFLFSTFFGGSSPGWAPRRDETVTFDEFVISTEPISH